ncbi:hypothetical protein ABE473_09475 [Stenotrophomonas sp. TWI700]|uniref:hypothetical protein n=1 Tax=Stenotrophomonas sp. TWI700 TaxID=3136792 RepID=UPI003207C8B8
MSGQALPPLWSPAQQSWLQAMGYTVFVDGSVEPEALVVPEIELHAAPVAEPPAPVRSPRPAPPADAPPPVRRNAPRTVEEQAPAIASAAAPARAGSGRRATVRMPDRLQIALLRASGCNPAEPDTQALMASWNLDELRSSAAAKRALWPQLRALRKRGRP